MAAAFEIETGIAIPAKSGGRGPGAKYPWAELRVGESFFVPSPGKYFFNQVCVAGKIYKRKFSARTIDGGIRVWRIA